MNIVGVLLYLLANERCLDLQFPTATKKTISQTPLKATNTRTPERRPITFLLFHAPGSRKWTTTPPMEMYQGQPPTVKEGRTQFLMKSK